MSSNSLSSPVVAVRLLCQSMATEQLHQRQAAAATLGLYDGEDRRIRIRQRPLFARKEEPSPLASLAVKRAYAALLEFADPKVYSSFFSQENTFSTVGSLAAEEQRQQSLRTVSKNSSIIAECAIEGTPLVERQQLQSSLSSGFLFARRLLIDAEFRLRNSTGPYSLSTPEKENDLHHGGLQIPGYGCEKETFASPTAVGADRLVIVTHNLLTRIQNRVEKSAATVANQSIAFDQDNHANLSCLGHDSRAINFSPEAVLTAIHAIFLSSSSARGLANNGPTTATTNEHATNQIARQRLTTSNRSADWHETETAGCSDDLAWTNDEFFPPISPRMTAAVRHNGMLSGALMNPNSDLSGFADDMANILNISPFESPMEAREVDLAGCHSKTQPKQNSVSENVANQEAPDSTMTNVVQEIVFKLLDKGTLDGLAIHERARAVTLLDLPTCAPLSQAHAHAILALQGIASTTFRYHSDAATFRAIICCKDDISHESFAGPPVEKLLTKIAYFATVFRQLENTIGQLTRKSQSGEHSAILRACTNELGAVLHDARTRVLSFADLNNKSASSLLRVWSRAKRSHAGLVWASAFGQTLLNSCSKPLFIPLVVDQLLDMESSNQTAEYDLQRRLLSAFGRIYCRLPDMIFNVDAQHVGKRLLAASGRKVKHEGLADYIWLAEHLSVTGADTCACDVQRPGCSECKNFEGVFMATCHKSTHVQLWREADVAEKIPISLFIEMNFGLILHSEITRLNAETVALFQEHFKLDRIMDEIADVFFLRNAVFVEVFAHEIVLSLKRNHSQENVSKLGELAPEFLNNCLRQAAIQLPDEICTTLNKFTFVALEECAGAVSSTWMLRVAQLFPVQVLFAEHTIQSYNGVLLHLLQFSVVKAALRETFKELCSLEWPRDKKTEPWLLQLRFYHRLMMHVTHSFQDFASTQLHRRLWPAFQSMVPTLHSIAAIEATQSKMLRKALHLCFLEARQEKAAHMISELLTRTQDFCFAILRRNYDAKPFSIDDFIKLQQIGESFLKQAQFVVGEVIPRMSGSSQFEALASGVDFNGWFRQTERPKR